MKKSIAFFDEQFRHPPSGDALRLNPFEEQALDYLSGDVLDFGCGMGNLAFAAAAKGCSVTALDASPAAVDHIRARAAEESIAVRVALADLRDYRIDRDYDSIVCIGLLMFFDCPSASKVLTHLQEHVRPGGYAVVNVLIQGTTYLEMFEPEDHCLFEPMEILNRFSGWTIVRSEFSDFAAPGATLKRFSTVIARKPAVHTVAGSH